MGQFASQPVMPAVDNAARAFIAADVGGTHARIGLVRGGSESGRVAVLDYRKYVCAEHESLDAILRDFLSRHEDAAITHGALACAGYAIDGVVVNDNLPWRVEVNELRDALGLADLSLINDFEAVAYATQYIEPSATLALTDAPLPEKTGPQVVVGPGTGLGSAAILPMQPQPLVLPTEAGQIALAPRGELEIGILGVMESRYRHVSYEHVLSGPGLLRLYQALCTLRAMPCRLERPEQITEAALQGSDDEARQTLDVFCALLGSFVGDLAMLYGASGGIWLAGGILPQIRSYLARSTFVERFLDKGRMRAFLQRVPIRLMEHGQLGVIGAAGWYLDHQDGG
ncbi:glucokinase [Oleiagrimonas sp. MCCC 1A03011]|uniref:glucokinase n=1 Tax=Oleiagrimonas sp. MCCC 1A03011 TaxID=1926883 RepID=UPI0026A91711